VILFEDECSLSNTATVSYKWAEKGKQPKVEQKQSNKERVTLFGGVDRKRGIVITQKAERGNAITFKKFLKKILRKLRKYKGKIWLILDNVKYHHAKLLKPFNIRVSRIAVGLPKEAEIVFTDSVTLSAAIRERKEYK